MQRKLEKYFNFLKKDRLSFLALAKIENGIFSKNHFVKTFDEFVEYVLNNKDCNVYCTYNDLKTNKNRKTENVKSLQMIALDIELINKTKPESEQALKMLKYYINEFITKYLKLSTYMLVHSGNGYHLYIPVKRILLDDNNLLKTKIGYSNFVEQLTKTLQQCSENFATCDDRKDLAGILRVPETMNTNANRLVHIVDIVENGENTYIQNILKKYIRKATVKLNKPTFEKNIVNIDDILLNENNVFNNIIVNLMINEDLPDDSGKHSTLVFALQNLIVKSNLTRSTIYKLEQLVKSNGISVSSLSTVSTELNLFEIYRNVFVWCKNNNFLEYQIKIKELIDKHFR